MKVSSRERESALVSLALTGDDKAMAELIALVTPTARAKAVAYSISGSAARLSADDLFQEGMLGFITALNSYSPCGEASFSTYAGACITNRIIDCVRRNSNGKNSSLTFAVPISELLETAGYSTPQDSVESDDGFRRIIAFITGDSLTHTERDVIRLHIEGKAYAEISAELGISVKSVDNALQRVRRKLKSADIMPR